MSRNIWIGIAVVVVLAAGGWWYLNQSNIPAISTTTQQNTTADTQTNNNQTTIDQSTLHTDSANPVISGKSNLTSSYPITTLAFQILPRDGYGHIGGSSQIINGRWSFSACGIKPGTYQLSVINPQTEQLNSQTGEITNPSVSVLATATLVVSAAAANDKTQSPMCAHD